MDAQWLDKRQLAAWVRLTAVLELLPGVLDSQLRREAGLTHFEYYVLAVLSETEEQSLQMTTLAARTNATLPRLSHVIRRLEDRGLVERRRSPDDARATCARLTELGWAKVQDSAPGHVATVRHHVIDALTDEQIDQLGEITEAMLERLDPEGRLIPVYRRHDS
ncbi:MarR family transcriptional regulator [Nesterenkonia xinjiangensis]|uniref:DNA-binding MarR family transcriptional regulator n=1 Tax=Nesterenkonia xinjiangensis TaxID=225327 RepID=A0A7Z0GJL0_9MICC|nr:DNA-binding MarR family transcriptional regulator [Nesterenkonia xinjiangensis]